MAKKRADVVSVAELGKAVDRAVALAAKRHEISAESGTLLANWEIVGRRLRDLEDLNVAFNFARDVTRAVKIQGLKVQPAVVKVGPDVLCGFIERAGLPRLISR